MSPFFAIFLVLLLASSSYAAGRLHGQLSYRIGYRFGYRQGYFDGDRGAWSRRQTRAAIAPAPPATEVAPVSAAGPPSVAVPPAGTGQLGAGPVVSPSATGLLTAPAPVLAARPVAPTTTARQGTTYTGASFAGSAASGAAFNGTAASGAGATPTAGTATAVTTATDGSGRHAREVLVGRRP